MIRVQACAVLAFCFVATHLAPPSLAQEVQEPPADADHPSFLQPAPRELLRQGMQPLSAELPNTQVREGLLPPDASQGLFGEQWAGNRRDDQWLPIDVHWAPSCNRHLPTYFEDTMLERHGQSRNELIQPAISGARFFTGIAAMPYNMVVDRPLRPMSTLGHFRAGSGVPLLLQRPPLQADAGLFEAGLIVGLIFIVP